MRVCHSNVINASTIDEVQYDSEGRAWCCVLIPASASQLGVDNCGSSISILLKQSCILPRLLFGIKLKTTPSSNEYTKDTENADAFENA
uniref:Uncharacterized protein n=1 Tax=Panagrellus redivivus TaxID=6233 RepID=A0A7E4VTR2_PANRE